MRLAGRERLGFYSLPIPDAERIRRFLATRVRAGELRRYRGSVVNADPGCPIVEWPSEKGLCVWVATCVHL